ncbi:MBL fold metallo-hydrolase [Dermabacter hominis]|uniref:MBL fold metallo-hydrolase n=1 Tax=Dermabacter hominis TaxID=36740 RepID=UPI00223A6A0F|nr:MBL fold metallo-hydrolase [Dermabacter hominis]MCT2026286.1 MBL fold metallo-hydrolase [Dermabacter hominis]
MNLRIDHAVTEGTFTLDGETFDVANNVWVVGNDEDCVVIDAPHDIDTIEKLVGERTLLAILLTHAHDDHARFAPELAERFDAPMLLHPGDKKLWALTHGDLEWDADLEDGDAFSIADHELNVIHTPGHSPGSVCYLLRSTTEGEPDQVFSGDTLFEGGPGATGRSYSDRGQIKDSIREKLFSLDDATIVHTGHGPDTTIGAERERAKGDWL